MTPDINQAVSPDSQNSYFAGENNYNRQEFKNKLKMWWEGFQYRARQVWPWVYRLINFIVYEIIKVLKAVVRLALQQIGLMKD